MQSEDVASTSEEGGVLELQAAKQRRQIRESHLDILKGTDGLLYESSKIYV